MARALRCARRGRSRARRHPSRPQAASVGGGDRARRQHDAAREAAGQHALVGAQARQGGRRFLRTIDRDRPKSLDLHLVVDNYATHKHAKVKAWFKRHPRFHLHFTPTSASWINLVERFFGLITDDAIRRGVFHSVTELKIAIEAYLEQHNVAAKPFIWTAPAADILEKVARGRRALESVYASSLSE